MIDAENISSEPNNDVWEEEDMNCAFMVRNVPSVAMAAVKTTKNDKTVILDPGSEISIFTAISLLKNLFEAAHPIKVWFILSFFGSYCHATVPKTNNTMENRSEPCICLLSAGNLTGSVRMLSLQTQAVITRDNFTLLPIPTSVVEFVGKLALAEGRKPTARFALQHQIDPLASASLPDLILADTSEPPALVDILGAARLGTPAIEVGDVPALEGRVREETADLPPSVPTSDQLDVGDADIGVEVLDDNSEIARADPQEELPCEAAPSLSSVLHISVKAALRTYGGAATAVINQELQQMLDKQVWTPVSARDLSI
jgi:hypothetical protein